MDWLKIKNYKSIEDLTIDCRRINIFIGKPNVGKSNILEAISLLNLDNTSEKLQLGKSSIRYEQIGNLFHYNNLKSPILIETSIGSCAINHVYKFDQFTYRTFPVGTEPSAISDFDANTNSIDELNRDFNSKISGPYFKEKNQVGHKIKNTVLPQINLMTREGRFNSISEYHNEINPIKKYDFSRYHSKDLGSERNAAYLMPPSGPNLLAILETSSALIQFSQEIFQQYNLELLIGKNDSLNDTLEIQRKEGFYVYKIPFSSVADTLQRIIFHFAAIESNHEAVLLFEEPEAHNFPPYIKTLAEKIAQDVNSNQYFITTHSPFLLNTLVESVDLNTLNVFTVGYEANKTTVKKIEDSVLLDMINYGQDIFFHLE